MRILRTNTRTKSLLLLLLAILALSYLSAYFQMPATQQMPLQKKILNIPPKNVLAGETLVPVATDSFQRPNMTGVGERLLTGRPGEYRQLLILLTV